MHSRIWASRLGAIFYIIWGVFHIAAAIGVYDLAQQSTATVKARLLQDAFYVLFFALATITIALTANWRNLRQGYWMNAVLVAVADIPFVLFVLAPGVMPWWPGLIGPILFVAAFACTSMSRIS